MSESIEKMVGRRIGCLKSLATLKITGTEAEGTSECALVGRVELDGKEDDLFVESIAYSDSLLNLQVRCNGRLLHLDFRIDSSGWDHGAR